MAVEPERDMQDRLAFLLEIDRLKSILRRTPLIDRSRRENSAEHSWHLAMYAMILAGSAGAAVDIERVIRMLLVHDIVEIDAGDHPLHEPVDARRQCELERRAAQRLFGILPAAQAAALIDLWREFEAGQSPDAAFARALDRLQPLLHNIATDGGTWAEADVAEMQVRERYGPAISAGSPELWAMAERLVAAHFSARGADPAREDPRMS